MENVDTRKWLLRALRAFCVMCLILLVLSEGYSAAATALDRFAPHWERLVGWGMFAFPCMMIFGIALLLYGEQQRVGFYCVILSASFYIGFMGLDVIHSGMGRGDWIDMSVWTMFCAICVGAARVLMVNHWVE